MGKRWWVFLIIAAILNIAIFIFDNEIMALAAFFRIFLLDWVFISVAFASNVIIIFFFLTSLFLWKEHKRRWILPLWMVSVFSIVISFLMKNIIRRARPFEAGVVSVLGIGQYFINDAFRFSFPSFQAMLVFSAVPILDKEFPKFKYIWLGFAVLVALSRVYFGLHYLSDVVSGALIGLLLGWFFIRIEEKYEFGRKFCRKLKLGK